MRSALIKGKNCQIPKLKSCGHVSASAMDTGTILHI